jgi:hypothetical protein
MLIYLETWEYEYASTIGIRRYTNNWDKPNAAHYDPSKMQEDRTAQVAAAICELAVAKAVNEYWSASIWKGTDHNTFKHLADVGKDIEVRRVRTQPGPAIREKDLLKGNQILFGAYAVEKEFKQVEILGWTTFKDGWENGIPTEYGKIVPREKLKTVGEYLGY